MYVSVVLCRVLIPHLLEKLADTKVIVRSAVMRVLRKLMVAASARAVLELLQAGLRHSSWRVREEVVNGIIIVSLCQQGGSVAYHGTLAHAHTNPHAHELVHCVRCSTLQQTQCGPQCSNTPGAVPSTSQQAEAAVASSW
jgi:hypothetical protein